MTDERKPPVWRSLVYVPANVERYVAKAHERVADGVILDLEDSVPPAEKASARVGVQAVQRQLLVPVASIILAGSPPVPDHAAEPLRFDSWGRRIPG